MRCADALAVVGVWLMVSAAHADTSPCPEGSFPVGSPPPDGYEQKCVLPDGKMQGLWRVWYPNGQLMSETPMDKGREHGELRAWWPNGQLMMRGQSIYGNRYRQFEYWDMSGHVQSVDTEAVETVIPAEGAPSAIRKVVEE